MAFTVVHPMNSQVLWAPVEPGSTIYTGSIVCQDQSAPGNGIISMPVAAGAANVTNLDVPWGVCIGNNNTGPNDVYNSTGQYVTAGAEATWHDNTTQYQGVEGPWAKGDGGEYISYIPITPETVLRGPICNAALGTAPSQVAVTTGSGTDGLDCTSAAIDFTPVADYATLFFRTGANRGIYRIVETTSTTVHTFTPACPADIAVGDELVAANLRFFGPSRAYIDSAGQYIDVSAALTTNYLIIDVLRLDLSEAGNEYVEFRFNPVNFITTDRA